jgi:hypothetical protein
MMMLRASAGPDEMPPASASASNRLRTVPFRPRFECVRPRPAVVADAALFVVVLMMCTFGFLSGSPTRAMIHLRRRRVGTVPHTLAAVGEATQTSAG